MELKIITKSIKGKTVDYLYCYIDGFGVCIGYIDGFGRLHIKN